MISAEQAWRSVISFLPMGAHDAEAVFMRPDPSRWYFWLGAEAEAAAPVFLARRRG